MSPKNYLTHARMANLIDSAQSLSARLDYLRAQARGLRLAINANDTDPFGAFSELQALIEKITQNELDARLHVARESELCTSARRRSTDYHREYMRKRRETNRHE